MEDVPLQHCPPKWPQQVRHGYTVVYVPAEPWPLTLSGNNPPDGNLERLLWNCRQWTGSPCRKNVSQGFFRSWRKYYCLWPLNMDDEPEQDYRRKSVGINPSWRPQHRQHSNRVLPHDGNRQQHIIPLRRSIPRQHGRDSSSISVEVRHLQAAGYDEHSEDFHSCLWEQYCTRTCYCLQQAIQRQRAEQDANSRFPCWHTWLRLLWFEPKPQNNLRQKARWDVQIPSSGRTL